MSVITFVVVVKMLAEEAVVTTVVFSRLTVFNKKGVKSKIVNIFVKYTSNAQNLLFLNSVFLSN